MPTRHPRFKVLALPLLALVTACGADEASLDEDRPEPPDTPAPARRTFGPLANAGPDRQVLEGQVVRLDAGSSQPGESGRPLRYLWTAEPGPDGAVPLAIDDPTARRIRVVAPALGEGEERVDVWLRLHVDDGLERAEDVMRLEVVRGPADAIAPVVSAGPDRQVFSGDTLTIGPRPGDDAIVDPACAGDCPAPEVTWTLVEGFGARLVPLEHPSPADGCSAPCARVETDATLATRGVDDHDVAGVLAFRVDLVSRITGLAAAPDFVRVLVTRSAHHTEPLPVSFDEPPRDLPWYVGTSRPQQVVGLVGRTDDPLGFRPILGEAEPMPGGNSGYRFEYGPPPTPAFLGWAFEGRRGRLRTAPRFLLVDWRGLGSGAPEADAGPDPVHLVEGAPLPPDGCDRVRLVGAGPLLATGLTTATACAHGRTHPDLEFCWIQTHGPATLAGVPAGCGPRADDFESGSLLAGCDSDLACPDLVVPGPVGDLPRVLAYQLQVRRRAQGAEPASVWSAPDTAVIRVVAGSRDDPPAARFTLSRLLGDGSLVPLGGPLGEGETVVVDASGSVDPEGLPLSFALDAGAAPLAFEPFEPCATAGACFAARAPTVLSPTSFPLSLTVSAGGSATVCGETGGVCLDRQGNPVDGPALAVDDTVNEPPVVTVAAELTAAPGATVLLDASGSRDPNGDPLSFAWTVLGGNAILAGADTSTPSFVAPSVPGEVLLEVRVGDDRGGEARATVRVRIVEASPPPGP